MTEKGSRDDRLPKHIENDENKQTTYWEDSEVRGIVSHAHRYFFLRPELHALKR